MMDKTSPSIDSPPPRRIMAIWLARLALDRWRQTEGCAPGEGADAEPTALMSETAHGLRIDAANEAALAAGAAPGMMLADARTLCPHLKVVRSDVAGDRAFLERLAIRARRWGPWSALDGPDGLLVDVTAVAHLFGGERCLLEDAAQFFAARRLFVRLAIAPTAGAAWALAHHARDRAILRPQDDARARLANLPVAALRLDPGVLLVLKRLGLKRVEDVSGIHRDALQRRFRSRDPSANPLLRLDQMLGRLPEPLLPVIAPSFALVQRRLLEPIRHRDLLDQVMADLAADMERELEKRGEGVRRLELALWRVDGDMTLRQLEFAAATRDGAHIQRLFRAKLDDIDAGFGIELVRMRAVWTEPLSLAQLDLGAGKEAPGTALAVCLDRLAVRLGPGAIRRPVPQGSHIPERAQRWRTLGERVPSLQESFAFHERPLKLLDKAEQISVLYATPDGYPNRFRWRGTLHEIVRVEGPERIAPEWWRARAGTRLRDYYRVEDSQGRRYWIYRAGLIGDGRGGAPEWFLQGLFA